MSARPFLLTADLLLRAYRLGLFPMAESRASKALHWLDPEYRGILPLLEFHLPRSLLKTVRGNKFTVTADADFAGTIAACAQARSNRPETWINLELERLFVELHRLGFAQVRVRHHGDLARVEIARTELPRALSLAMLDAITAALRPAGFLYITLDTQGYRSGSMNAVLPLSSIAAAR